MRALILDADAGARSGSDDNRVAGEERTCDLLEHAGKGRNDAAERSVRDVAQGDALQGKELALELERRDDIENLPLRQRNDLRIAVRHLVRAAYLLDWYGDLGNKQQVSGAYDIFDAAVDDIARAYEGTR